MPGRELLAASRETGAAGRDSPCQADSSDNQRTTLLEREMLNAHAHVNTHAHANANVNVNVNVFSKEHSIELPSMKISRSLGSPSASVTRLDEFIQSIQLS